MASHQLEQVSSSSITEEENSPTSSYCLSALTRKISKNKKLEPTFKRGNYRKITDEQRKQFLNLVLEKNYSI